MSASRRTHLITGAGSGIGAGLAQALDARGDRLVLLARSPERAEELAGRYDGAVTVVADLADADALDAAVAAGLAEHAVERLDSVLHVAGVVGLGPVADLSTGAWRAQLDVNLLAPAVLTRACLPAVRAASGLVVFVNSGAGLNANPGWSAYAASKFGLRALADALRIEEHAHGVRVTSVYPGRTATPMQAEVHRQEGKQYDPTAWIDPASVVSAILHALDLPRDATIPDLTIRPAPR